MSTGPRSPARCASRIVVAGEVASERPTPASERPVLPPSPSFDPSNPEPPPSPHAIAAAAPEASVVTKKTSRKRFRKAKQHKRSAVLLPRLHRRHGSAKVGGVSPDEIKALRKELVCTAKELAQALGIEQT